MTGAPAAMPSVEDVARVIAPYAWTQIDADRISSSPLGAAWERSVTGKSLKAARAILDLFAPILAEKERLIAECEPYLKEGETPRERFDRDFKEIQGLAELLAKSRAAREWCWPHLRWADIASTMNCDLKITMSSEQWTGTRRLVQAAIEAASFAQSVGERITRKDLNNAYRKGQEDGQMCEKLTHGTEVALKPGWLKRDTEKAAARVKEWDSVHEYVERYEFRGDQDYTPNDHEKALIEDAINGYVGAMNDGG